MAEMAWFHGGEATSSSRSTAGWTGHDTLGGRHALDEDAVLTPIFHALSCSGWPRSDRHGRQHEQPAAIDRAATVDPVVAFRRDPLGAPLPQHAPGGPVHHAAGRRRAAHAIAEVPVGRHHRHAVPIGHAGN